MADTFLITGTCGTAWHGLAKLLAPASIDHSKSAALPVGAGPYFLSQPTTAISQLLVSHRDLQVAAFCESPAAFLAAKAAEPGETSFEDALQAWCESAEVLLAFWRKHRNCVHLLDWNECCAFPGEFRNWLQNATDLRGEWALDPQELGYGHIETLRQVVCQQVVKEERFALRLWREIQAACQPLSSVFQSEPPLSGALLATLRSLDKVQAEQAWLHDERSTLNSRISTLTAERNDLTIRHQALASEKSALASRLSTHNAEREALLADLQKQKEQALQTQEMLLCDIQKAFEESESFFTQMEASRAEVEDLKSVLELTRTEFQATHTSLLIERDTLTSELVKQKEEATQTNKMLLTAIQSAHLESEKFYEEWKTLEAATNFHPLKVCAVSRGNEIISPPHCHLDFSFERLELFDRRWPRLAVRLVEHNGHAGLVVFDTPTEKNRPLFHWNPTGQENGIAYMLFVPTDKPALDRLVALPTTDLILLRCIIAKILGHLSVRGTPPRVLWPSVARRLLQQIEEIPERLHYDSIVATPAFGATGKAIDFTANLLFFRGDVIERFRWTWIPRSRGGEIVLKKDMGAATLTLGWPQDRDTMCLGAENSEAINRTRIVWNQFLQRDRTFLRLIVAALPDFIFHFCEQHPTSDREQKDLLRQAQTLRRRLDKLSQPKRRRILAVRINAP